jgi:hypothetical protein
MIRLCGPDVTRTSSATNSPTGKRNPYKGYHEDSHVSIRLNYIMVHSVSKSCYTQLLCLWMVTLRNTNGAHINKLMCFQE